MTKLLAARQQLSDPPNRAGREGKMEQQASVMSEGDGLSEDFMLKVADWEKDGVFDQLAAKIAEAVEETYEGHTK